MNPTGKVEVKNKANLNQKIQRSEVMAGGRESLSRPWEAG